MCLDKFYENSKSFRTIVFMFKKLHKREVRSGGQIPPSSWNRSDYFLKKCFWHKLPVLTLPKMKFIIKDYFNTYELILAKLRIFWYLLIKWSMENSFLENSKSFLTRLVLGAGMSYYIWIPGYRFSLDFAFLLMKLNLLT